MRKFFSIILIVLLAFPACEIDTEDDDPYIDDDPRDAITGEWVCNETPVARFSYPVVISEDPANSSQVLISNFGFIGEDEKPPYAILAGNTLSIPVQNIGNDNSVEVEGFGQIKNDNEIIWDYTLRIGGDANDYNAVYSR